MPAASTTSTRGLAIVQGTAVAMFAYDVAMGIAVGRVEALAGKPETIPRLRPTPREFQYRPAPIRVVEDLSPIELADFATTDRVEAVLYDFGAVSVRYHVPIKGPLEALLPLAEALQDNPELLADSRSRVRRLMERFADAMDRPHLAEFVEDYVVYQVDSHDHEGPITGVAADPEIALPIAQLLRAERDPMSADEVGSALSARISYGPNDLVVADWNAALIIGKETDALAVLEHANLELLELRQLDDRLDGILSTAYAALLEPRTWLPLRSRGELRRLARLQVDNAMLFEGVHNALKLVGDQYLARVHQLAARRFHLSEWEASVRRKLEVLESMYAKTYQRAATIRLEALEWLVILLIALSMVMPFIPGLTPGK